MARRFDYSCIKINPSVSKYPVIILLTVLMSLAGFAQFNDSTHHFFSYASTGVINRTNDNRSFILSNAVKFNVVRNHTTINTGAGWIYGNQQGNLTNNDFTAGVDFDLYKTAHHIYYWGLANYLTSYSLKIDHQFQTGIGIGYDFIDNKYGLLLISNGILFEKSELNSAQLGHDRYETFRNSFRIKYRWVIQDRLVLTGSHFYQQSLSLGRDYIIISTAAASVRIKKWLSLNIAENYNKFNRTKRENFLITYGLQIEKFF